MKWRVFYGDLSQMLRGNHAFLAILLFITSQPLLAASVAPTTEVQIEIEFKDDLNFTNMQLAIDRQLVFFNRTNLQKSFVMGGKTFTRKDLKETLLHFQKIMQETVDCLKLNKNNCYSTFNQKVNEDFHVFRPLPKKTEAGYATGETLFTAYYSPDFHGSKVQTDIYKYPIYAMPKDPKLQRLTRKQIDFEGKLKGKGLELFYVSEHPYDIWLLHVEGGGRVVTTDEAGNKTFHHLSYAGSNKQKFQMLYKYMKEQGDA
jgi:membrane-bound lytic murein transglycosylase